MRKKRKPNVLKLSELQYYAFKNCIRLHAQSLFLLEHKENETAFFISVIALEELGKVAILDEIIWNVIANDYDVDESNWWFKWTYQHRTKQHFPITELTHCDVPPLIRLVEDICKGKLEVKKQNALYVGLTGRDIRGKLILPRLKRAEVKRQIRLLNSLLIEIIERKLDYGELFEGEYVDRLLHRKLLKELREVEPTIS